MAFLTLSTLSLLAGSTLAAPFSLPAPNAPYSLQLDGLSYEWKSTVAYGEVSPLAIDAFGDSLGSLGSAMDIQSFTRLNSTSFSGRLVCQPDRGPNRGGTVNYAARSQFLDFVFTPCMTNNCTATPSLSLNYTGGLRYLDTAASNNNNALTSGLDPAGARPASGNFPILPVASNGALSVDAEGIALMNDGTFWISEEYGPSVYHIAANGTILSALDMPASITPKNAAGEVVFTTTDAAGEDAQPASGRSVNQGFEGVTISTDESRLYVVLQSAVRQDYDSSFDDGRFTRMLEYDISDMLATKLVAQYVIELPQRDPDSIFKTSEIHYVSDNVFLLIARDGRGNGNGDSPSSSASISSRTSVFKNIGLISTASATNINGMYDNFGDAVSPGGVLRPEITAVAFNAFTNIADATQLAKFGLQNGPTPDESRNIVGKWEALSLVPANDPSNPSDYFLFSAADNDFIATDVTRDGESIGGDPYGVDVPNQFFVHLVTLGKATEEGGKMKKAKKDKKH